MWGNFKSKQYLFVNKIHIFYNINIGLYSFGVDLNNLCLKLAEMYAETIVLILLVQCVIIFFTSDTVSYSVRTFPH